MYSLALSASSACFICEERQEDNPTNKKANRRKERKGIPFIETLPTCESVRSFSIEDAPIHMLYNSVTHCFAQILSCEDLKSGLKSSAEQGEGT